MCLAKKTTLPTLRDQLGGVVGCQTGLGLTDVAHHREDVVPDLSLVGLLPLPRGHPAHQLVVDAVDRSGAPPLQSAQVARHHAVGELPLGLADRATDTVVELDGQVGDAPRRDVSRHVDLAAPHDAHVDDAPACRGVEAGIAGHEPGLLQGGHQLPARLLVVDPAQELPDGPEVLDVVDQRGSRERHHQRAADPATDPLGDLQHVLGALRGLVLDEVRLVDDHAAEAELAQPTDVPIEDLVVDDDDVREAVNGVPVTVDDGRRALGGPEVSLARPVGLHDIRHDHEQRVGVGCVGREQCLGGLAQAGFVGEQERAMARGCCRDHLRLVRHQRQGTRDAHERGLGQRHAGRDAAAAVLEGAEQRAEQLPAGQPLGPDLGLGCGLEVGSEEGVGELAGDDRLRHDPALGGFGRVCLDRGDLLRGNLDPGLLEQFAAQRSGRFGHLGVLSKEREQGGVARCGPGQDRRDAVEALELLGCTGGGAGLVLPDPRPLLAHEQGDDLELRAHRGLGRSPPDGGLHLADDPGEHRDDALVVVRAGALGAGGMASRGLTLALTSQEHLPRVSGTQGAVRDCPRTRPWCRAHGTSSCGRRRCVTTTVVSRIQGGPTRQA